MHKKTEVISIFKYKQAGRIGLFDKEETSNKLSKLGNHLEKLHKAIYFEMFRMELEDSMLNRDKKNNAGCKPHDVVLMFKILLLKRFYNLSDEQGGISNIRILRYTTVSQQRSCSWIAMEDSQIDKQINR